MASIKNEIIGSWKLLSYIEVPINGEDSMFPVGTTPKGILMFNPDGYMSVQITSSDCKTFKSDDRMVASDEEIRNRLFSYISFSGKYTVNNKVACVTYHIETALFPNWMGTKQVRKLDFENDILYQKTLEPILSNGNKVHAYMTWQKIEKSATSEKLKEELHQKIMEELG